MKKMGAYVSFSPTSHHPPPPLPPWLSNWWINKVVSQKGGYLWRGLTKEKYYYFIIAILHMPFHNIPHETQASFWSRSCLNEIKIIQLYLDSAKGWASFGNSVWH